jgi:ribosome-binding factor A
VYWTVHGDTEIREQTAQGLSAARGYLRHELSTLALRVLPELHFTYDEAIDRGDRIERLLREVHEADEQRSGEATGGGRGPEHADAQLLPEKE